MNTNPGLIILWIAAFLGGLFGGLAWAYPRMPEDFYLRRWIDGLRGKASARRESDTTTHHPVDLPMLLGGIISLLGSIVAMIAAFNEGIVFDLIAAALLVTGATLIYLRLRSLRRAS